MRISGLALSLFVGGVAASVSSDPPIPLASGDYVFTHRFSEHPTLPSLQFTVRIRGTQVTVVNPVASDPFPAGVIDEGTLMWHPRSGQWIVGQHEGDRRVRDVGGCSEGPSIIDLARRIYWTC